MDRKIRLSAEKNEIISEMNYHDIQEYLRTKGTHISISSIRDELDKLLEDFIDSHIERKTMETRTGHWIIGFDYNYDVETPSLYATYSVKITSYVSLPRE